MPPEVLRDLLGLFQKFSKLQSGSADTRPSSLRIGGTSKITHEFKFTRDGPGIFAHKRLVGYSGAYTKKSDLLGKMVADEYIPLPSATRYTFKKLDCNVMLPALAQTKQHVDNALPILRVRNLVRDPFSFLGVTLGKPRIPSSQRS